MQQQPFGGNYIALVCSYFVLYCSGMVDILPDIPTKGRGAVSNQSGRFENLSRARADDGWSPSAPEPAKTVLRVDTARTVISRNNSPDIPFDRSINPYRGCEHGCVYCFARPTHAYYGLSPGLDFETRLFHKPDAPERLIEELSKKNYKPAVIAMGTNTDPYQPVERTQKLTRQILQVLSEARHPVSIVTKSDLVVRDLDILAPMAERGLVSVALSVTTLDRDLARRMEPRAAAPRKRLDAISALRQAGIPTGVMAAPMIPALNDSELEAVLEAAANAGATKAGYILIRLPREIGPLFEEWLAAHYPDRASRVMRLIRETRGGALYNADWKQRMKGTGVYAGLLKQRFAAACRRLNLNERLLDLDTTQFVRPVKKSGQMTLF